MSKNRIEKQPVEASSGTAPEIVVETPSAAISATGTVSAALASAPQGDSYEERLARANMRIRTLVHDMPEMADTIEELAALTAPVKGMEGTSGGISIPVINIRQGMTSSDKVPPGTDMGEMYTSSGERLGKTLRFIPLLGHRKRVKFVTGVERPDCTSNDAKVGSKYGDCEVCPHGRYVEGQRTACSLGWGYIVATEDLQSIYRIDFMKTSANTGKKIPQLTRKPAIYSVVLELATAQEKNDKGTYHVYKVAPTGVRVQNGAFQICDALHDLFQLQHHHYIERAIERALRSTGSDGVSKQLGQGEGSGDGGSDNMDFNM